MTYLLWLCSLIGVNEAPRVTDIYTVHFLDRMFRRYWDNLYYIRRVSERSYYYGEVDL